MMLVSGQPYTVMTYNIGFGAYLPEYSCFIVPSTSMVCLSVMRVSGVTVRFILPFSLSPMILILYFLRSCLLSPMRRSETAPTRIFLCHWAFAISISALWLSETIFRVLWTKKCSDMEDLLNLLHHSQHQHGLSVRDARVRRDSQILWLSETIFRVLWKPLPF